MATSLSWDYSRTAAQIIAGVMEDLGVLASGGTIVAADETLALSRLNMLVKQWQGSADFAAGLKIYSRQRVTLFLAEGQQTYLIGPASGDARATTRYGRTTIDAAEAAAQTVLSVAATSDTTTEPGTTITATASDFLGVEQDDGTIFWSTVSSISAGDTITAAAGITVASAVGRYVWWFTTRAQRFPVIESAVLRDEDFKDTPLAVYTDARQYDQGVTDKYVDGDPTAILIEPLRTQTRVTLNAQPTDVTKTIVMTVQYPAEDYDATTNDIAMPQEGLLALHWALAKLCAPAFGVTWTQVMKENHDTALAIYRNLNPENSVLYFQPGGA